MKEKPAALTAHRKATENPHDISSPYEVAAVSPMYKAKQQRYVLTRVIYSAGNKTYN